MIDWPRVKELREEVGAEDFGEVVEIFLEEVEGVMEKLKTEGSTQLEQDLHFLKGAALNLGFAQFSTLCLEGERAAADGQADSVALPEILQSFETSKAVFLTELPERF